MASLKQRLRRKNSSGDYDVIYLQSDMSNVTGTLGVSNGGTGNTSVDTTPTSNSTKMCTSGGIYTELQTVKTSVSEGKASIASAITDKGVSTSSTDSFATMSSNIRAIPTGTPVVKMGWFSCGVSSYNWRGADVYWYTESAGTKYRAQLNDSDYYCMPHVVYGMHANNQYTDLSPHTIYIPKNIVLTLTCGGEAGYAGVYYNGVSKGTSFTFTVTTDIYIETVPAVRSGEVRAYPMYIYTQ